LLNKWRTKWRILVWGLVWRWLRKLWGSKRMEYRRIFGRWVSYTISCSMASILTLVTRITKLLKRSSLVLLILKGWTFRTTLRILYLSVWQSTLKREFNGIKFMIIHWLRRSKRCIMIWAKWSLLELKLTNNFIRSRRISEYLIICCIPRRMEA
jgi:hypothetical protein